MISKTITCKKKNTIKILKNNNKLTLLLHNKDIRVIDNKYICSIKLNIFIFNNIGEKNFLKYYYTLDKNQKVGILCHFTPLSPEISV